MPLNKINRNGVDLSVDDRQLPRFLADGWSITAAPVVRPAPIFERPIVELVEVWRGDEVRRCTVEQLRQMSAMGFKVKEKQDGGQRKHSEQSEDLREQPLSDEPRKRIEGLFGGNSRSGSEVGLGGDSGAGSEADAGLDDEQAEGAVTRVPDRASTDEEIRAAFAKLDPANDEHWTRQGAPRLEILNGYLEQAPVNRIQANAATENALRPTV